MNIKISGIAEKVIQSIIDAGDATSPEEAIALMARRTVCERELLPSKDDAETVAAILAGIESGEAGLLTKGDWNDLHAKLDHYLADNQGQRSAG